MSSTVELMDACPHCGQRVLVRVVWVCHECGRTDGVRPEGCGHCGKEALPGHPVFGGHVQYEDPHTKEYLYVREGAVTRSEGR